MAVLDTFINRKANTLTLKTNAVQLGKNGHVLAPLADAQGNLSIKIEEDNASSNPRTIKGKMRVWGTEYQVKAVFQTSLAKVEAFYIVVTLPANWIMTSLLATVPQSAENKTGAALFEETKFKGAYLFVAGNMPQIHDTDFGWDGLSVESGLNLVADSMQLPYDKLGNKWLAGWTEDILGSEIEGATIRGILNSHQQVPHLVLSFATYKEASLGPFHISNWSVIKGTSLPKQGSARQDELILSLQCDIGDLKNISIAGRFDKTGQLSLDGIFHEPLSLSKGINTLASLGGGGDIEAQLPSFGEHTPTIGLHELKLGFNTTTKEVNEVVAILEVVDSTTGGTMTWDVVETPKLSIEAPKVGIHLSKANQWKPQVEIYGKANIHNWIFEASYQQGSRIDARFVHQGNADLASFADSAFGGLHIPHMNFEVTDASYTYFFGPKRHAFAIELQGKFDPGGHGTFVLEDINLQVSKDSSGSRQFVLGQFELGGTHLSVQAAHQSDGSWEFEGRSKAGEEIKITNLFAQLLGNFGATVPHEFPDISLSDVELAYNSAANSVHIAGKSQWKIPDDIPFGGSTETIQVAIISAKDTTGARATEVQLSWMHKPADSEESLLVTASYSRDTGPAFFIEWKGEGEHTIGLKDLLELTNMESLLGLKPLEELAKFELAEVFMGFTLHPISLDLGAVWKITNWNDESHMVLMECSFSRDGNDESLSLSINGAEEDDLMGLTNFLGIDNWGEHFSDSVPGSQEIFTGDILTYDKVHVEFEEHEGLRYLSAEAEASHNFFEDIFLGARNSGSGWGIAMGARFADKSLSDIPGIDSIDLLDKITEIVDFKPLFIIFSDMKDQKYIPPGMIPAEVLDLSSDHAQQQDLPAEELLLKERKQKRMLLANALQIAGEITFGSSSNPAMQTLSKAIDLDGIIGQIIIGKGTDSNTNTIGLRAILPGRVSFSAGHDQFVIEDGILSISFKGDELTVGISGTIDLVIGHEHHTFTVTLDVDEHGIYGLIQVEDGPPLPPPAAFPGVVLHKEYNLELGLQFEPEGVDLGFMVDFHVLEEQYHGNASMVLEMIEEIPVLQYAAFAMNDLNLFLMFEVFTGLGKYMKEANDVAKFVQKADAYISDGNDPVGILSHYTEEGLKSLYNQYKALEPIFDKIAFRDVSMHYAKSRILIPDGSYVKPGERFEGFMDMFGFTIYGKFEFQSGNGTSAFKAKAQMDPINLVDVLKLTGAGEEIKRKKNGWEPGKDIWPGGSDDKTSWEAISAKEEVLIEAGGPVVEINSGHSPYFHIDFEVELFQVLHTQVSAEVADNGFDFRYHASAGRVANIDLSCSLGKEGFHAEGSFSVQLDIDIDMPDILGVHLPSIDLDTGFEGSLEITVSSTEFELIVNGDFDFEGTQLDLPEIRITNKDSEEVFSDLKELAGKVEQQILDNAEDLFEDLFAGAGHLIINGINEAGKIGKKAAKEAEKIGKDALKKGKKALHDAEGEAIKVGEDIMKGAENAEKEAKKLAADAFNEVGQIGDDAEKAAKKLGEEGKKALNHAKDEANKIGKAVGKEVAEIADKVGKILGPAFEEAKAVLEDAEKVAKAALHAAEEVAGHILDGAKKAVEGIKNAAKAVWHEAEKLKNAFKKGWNKAKKFAKHPFGL